MFFRKVFIDVYEHTNLLTFYAGKEINTNFSIGCKSDLTSINISSVGGLKLMGVSVVCVR